MAKISPTRFFASPWIRKQYLNLSYCLATRHGTWGQHTGGEDGNLLSTCSAAAWRPGPLPSGPVRPRGSRLSLSRISFSTASRASLTGTPGSRSRVSITSTLKGRFGAAHIDPAGGVDLFNGQGHAPFRIPPVKKRRGQRAADDDRILRQGEATGQRHEHQLPKGSPPFSVLPIFMSCPSFDSCQPLVRVRKSILFPIESKYLAIMQFTRYGQHRTEQAGVRSASGARPFFSCRVPVSFS